MVTLSPRLPARTLLFISAMIVQVPPGFVARDMPLRIKLQALVSEYEAMIMHHWYLLIAILRPVSLPIRSSGMRGSRARSSDTSWLSASSTCFPATERISSYHMSNHKHQRQRWSPP